MPMDLHSQARQLMVMFAPVATLPSLGPVAIGGKEDTQLQARAYPLPPVISMQGSLSLVLILHLLKLIHK